MSSIFVSYNFTVGQITPIPKKGKKDFTACNLFQPITVSCTICKLFGLIVLDEIVSKCYIPPVWLPKKVLARSMPFLL